MKKNILILGSSGQIGNHLKEYLNKKKYKVLEFDLERSKEEDLRISNNKVLIQKIKRSDFIFFLAFDVGGSRYLKKYQNTFEFISNNTKLMENTFSLIKKYNKPFLFASSQMSNMVYSPYGLLKNIGEKYSEALGGLSVKFWNVYGIEKNLQKSHVITDFILMALKQKKINMLTSGKEKRDFLFAEDCCEGLEKIYLNYNKIRKLKKSIDLTTGKYTSIKEIAKIIKKILKNKNINIKIYASKIKDTVQKDKRNNPNMFLKKYWKPKYSLDSGINKIINYYVKK
ncbi:NAD-dependent epimerase/dehydratase family protein [Candidatus Pelagibacter communis]|uniref:NAD-dependent epimerase/dehydratase family protein n=1 Tax=Pelagibacter ubique TaxID=198252 RepID=UPI00065B44E4|nr:NAD(P)-dependent oxidoreductase [Candidatus Pelagibacter ubique]